MPRIGTCHERVCGLSSRPQPKLLTLNPNPESWSLRPEPQDPKPSTLKFLFLSVEPRYKGMSAMTKATLPLLLHLAV